MTDVSNGLHAAADYIKDSFFSESTTVVGTDIIATKTVAIANANSVVVSGVGLVIITQDKTQQEELIIEADEAVMSYIETEVIGNELTIRLHNNVSIQTTAQNVYRLRVKDLVRAELSGAVTVEMKEINIKTLTLDVRGSSKVMGTLSTENLIIHALGASYIVLSGIASEQNVNISGSSTFDGRDLQGKNSEVNGRGSVQLYCNVSDFIKGRLSGAGSLRYSGDPIINIQTSGAVSVGKL
jgi:hypothetical protein